MNIPTIPLVSHRTIPFKSSLKKLSPQYLHCHTFSLKSCPPGIPKKNCAKRSLKTPLAANISVPLSQSSLLITQQPQQTQTLNPLAQKCQESLDRGSQQGCPILRGTLSAVPLEPRIFTWPCSVYSLIPDLLRSRQTGAGGQPFVKPMRNPTWLRPAGRSLLFLSGHISGWFHA